MATAASVTLTGSFAGPAAAATHLVRPGETLGGIARRYDTSVTALVRINRLADPNLIVAGQRLRVGSRARVASIHVVRAGETLSGIAARYGTTIGALVRVNRLDDPNLIVSGTRLRVPRGGGSVAPSSGGRPGTSVASSLQNQSVAHSVDPALVKAVAWQESGWNQGARSSAGAIGVMQVMPDTARYVNQVLGGGHDLKVRRMDDNVHLGVMYLRHMLGTMRTRGRALAAYYSGPGNVKKRLDQGQRAYVRNVKALVGRFR